MGGRAEQVNTLLTQQGYPGGGGGVPAESGWRGAAASLSLSSCSQTPLVSSMKPHMVGCRAERGKGYRTSEVGSRPTCGQPAMACTACRYEYPGPVNPRLLRALFT